MKKSICLIFCIAFIACLFSGNAYAAVDYATDVPYDTYIYDNYNNPISVPEAFSVEKVVRAGFKELSDVCYTADGSVFLCDSGNNRIVITDAELENIRELSVFDAFGTEEHFSAPKGVWADETRLYVADTGNGRIVAFDRNGDKLVCKSIYSRPEIALLDDNYEYSPVRLSVDRTGKMYVIASGINQGIICLDETGKFQNFLGAPNVEPNFLESLWRRVATKEQLSQLDSYVPTEYNAIAADKYGFLYAVSQTSNESPVRKLNSDGDNVLTKPYDDYGDSCYLNNDSDGYKPFFTDVALNISGRIGDDIYYVLDSKQGKIYAYTEGGELLYAFGANGTQKGTFYNASAIEYIPNDNGGLLLVTDAFKGTVTILRETDFSLKVRNALLLYSSGEYDSAEEVWLQVKEIASGYLPADVGLARIELHNKQYSKALSRLKVIRRYDLYDEAFSNYRDSFVKQYFPYILLGIIVLIASVIAVRKLAAKNACLTKLKASSVWRGYSYSNYVIFHPFDGFWDLKHEKRGNGISAAVIAVLFFVLYALRLQFGGYIATGYAQGDVNVLYHVMMLLLPLVFYVIANWCFTTLMDGKGNMRDIIIATCYALKPYVIFAIPMLLLSNVITTAELPFYTFFNTVIMIWIVFLLFAGLMMTHDYTPAKTVLTVILILVGICLIIFIIMLVISIIQNIWQFAYNTYQEISFRSY